MPLAHLLLCLLSVLALSAFAQSPTATLTGTVLDGSGAPVPDAAIELRHTGTNDVRQARSDEKGEFTITNLAPGVYDLMIQKPGFRRLEESAIELQVDQTARLELKLEVGSMTEMVEVRAEAPLLNTENASRGDVVVNQEITEMPLDGRDFGDLAYLVPGVQRKARGGSGSNWAINGARADNTNFVVDGFNDQNPRGGGAQVRPPLDATSEFKMQTTGYSAEFGRLAGGVMNMVLKSGANRPHGTLFEFLRNDKLDARDFFSVEKTKLRRNQFGASLSGPVWIPKIYRGRDRTFFLLAWESYRQVVGSTRLSRVPEPLERQGDFSQARDVNGQPILLKDPLASGACAAGDTAGCFPGNRIPADRIHPVAARLMAFYPLPNRPGQANNYLVNANDGDEWDSFLYKIDHRLSAGNSLSFRGLQRANHETDPFAGSPLGTFGKFNNIRQSLFGLGYTRIFSPVLINEFRAALTRTARSEKSRDAERNLAAELGIEGTTADPMLFGSPKISIRDLATLGDEPKTPLQWVVNNIEWADTLTWVRGRHLMKFGFDILRTQNFQQSTSNNVRGTFNFLGRWSNDPFADFLLGLLNNSSRQVGKAPAYLLMTTYGFFAQNDLRVSPRVTLNLGLRHEIMKPPYEKFGRLSNFLPEFGKLVLADDRTVPDLEQRAAEAGLSERVALARDYGLPTTLVYARYRNLAPRLGFAWRPREGNRLVVRGGYGIFFGGSMSDPIRQDLTSVYPFTVSQTFQRNSSKPSVLTLSTPFPDARTTLEGVTNVAGYELHPPAQNLQSWNLTVERELGAEAAIEIAYAGSKGTHLGRKYNLNQPYRIPEWRLPGGGFPKPHQIFNTIDYYSFGANSIYNGAIVTLRRRLSRGFFYRVGYVFSKSIDDASQVSGSSDGGYPGAQDARNLKLERGRSDWDNGHAVLVSFLYEVPVRRNGILRGWQLAGSGRAYTGQPFTPRVSNVQLDQGEANRPDRIAKGRLERRTVERWFDLPAFPVVAPGSYRFGNSGRNILDGPGLVAMNVSLMKRFRVRERGSLQFRCEAFNVTNHPNLNQPENNVNATNGGTITRADPPRLIQFGLRYSF